MTNLNFRMTPREALAIQATQVQHYSRHRADLAEFVAAQTDVKGVDLDVELSMREINRRIPRGGDIERFCGIGGTVD